MQVKPLKPNAQRSNLSNSSPMVFSESEPTDDVEATHSSCLCSYQNQTSTIQVIRIADLPERQFERVVFPGQRLMFYAPGQARLKVYTSSQAGALLADSLVCDRIRVSSD